MKENFFKGNYGVFTHYLTVAATTSEAWNARTAQYDAKGWQSNSMKRAQNGCFSRWARLRATLRRQTALTTASPACIHRAAPSGIWWKP